MHISGRLERSASGYHSLPLPSRPRAENKDLLSGIRSWSGLLKARFLLASKKVSVWMIIGFMRNNEASEHNDPPQDSFTSAMQIL
jgi:hypothetical protein